MRAWIEKVHFEKAKVSQNVPEIAPWTELRRQSCGLRSTKQNISLFSIYWRIKRDNTTADLTPGDQVLTHLIVFEGLSKAWVDPSRVISTFCARILPAVKYWAAVSVFLAGWRWPVFLDRLLLGSLWISFEKTRIWHWGQLDSWTPNEHPTLSGKHWHIPLSFSNEFSMNLCSVCQSCLSRGIGQSDCGGQLWKWTGQKGSMRPWEFVGCVPRRHWIDQQTS